MTPKPCPSPRACAHEPTIREGLAAAARLAGIEHAKFHYQAWPANEGPEPCLHGYGKGIPCPHCDRIALGRAYEFVVRQAPWIELPCVSSQITELQATIQGLKERVGDLLESTRRMEWARDEAIERLRILQSENGKATSDAERCSVEAPDVRLPELGAGRSLVGATMPERKGRTS